MVNRNTQIRGGQMFDSTIDVEKLNINNAPVDGYFLAFDNASGKLEFRAGIDAVTEIPTGAINDVNDTFTITNTPADQSIAVYLNGLYQEEGSGKDYQLSGTTIVFNTAPNTGDLLIASYTKNVSSGSGNLFKGAFEFIIDGGDVEILTGVKGEIEIPFDCTITSVRLIADQVGSIVVDINKSTYATFPTVASITGGSEPTISSAIKSEDTTLTGWTLELSAGDIIQYEVDSVTSIERCLVSLNLLKS
jgi:hypothetical protein